MSGNSINDSWKSQFYEINKLSNQHNRRMLIKSKIFRAGTETVFMKSASTNEICIVIFQPA